MKKMVAVAAIAALVAIPSASYADTTASPNPKAKINQEYKAALDK